jgi:hypothetical protein
MVSHDKAESQIARRHSTLEECFLNVNWRFNKSGGFDGNNREPEAHAPIATRGCLSRAAQAPSTPGLRTLQGKRRIRSLNARDRLLNL